MQGVPKDDDDGFQQFLDTAYASVAKDGVLPLLQGDPNSADLATSRVKDILEDLLSTESSDNISRIRAEARAESQEESSAYVEALAAAQAKHEGMEERLGEMEIALGSLQREKAEWEELRGHLTSENTKISARLLEAQSELDGERHERARRESDVAELDDQLRSAVVKHEALKKRWKAEMKELQESSAKAEQAAATEKEERERLLSNATAQLRKTESELQQSRDDADVNSARADRAIQEANALKKSLEADLSAAEHLLAKSERQRLEFRAADEGKAAEIERLGTIQQHCVALEQQLRESEATIARMREENAVAEAQQSGAAAATAAETARAEEAKTLLTAELANAHAEAESAAEERSELRKDLATARQEAESAHAASLRAREAQDTAERESAAALAQLSEKLGAQIEAREQRLTAERGTHEAAMKQAMEQFAAEKQATLEGQAASFAREKAAALASAAAEQDAAVSAAVSAAEAEADKRLAARVKEVEFDHRALLAESESKQQTTMQQQLFEARMTELHSLQKSLQSEKDTLFTLEERMEQMVSDRVATMNENIPITQHQAILREKLSESEARAVALRQELLAKCEAEQEAAVTAVEAKRHEEYNEAIAALKSNLATMQQAVDEAKSREADAERKTHEMSANRDACQITITEIRGELGVKQSEIGTLQKVAAEDDQIKTTLRQEAELASKHLLGVEAELRGAHESQQRLQQMLEDERRAWKAKVEAEAQARHDAETHAAEKESDASQVMVLKTELAKKEEALRRMEQDKVHFMGNLDKTMAELTESVERREAATVEEVKQAAEKHIASVTEQWRTKHDEYVEASRGQLESLRTALDKAETTHVATLESLRKDHANGQALAAAEHDSALSSIRSTLEAELTSTRTAHAAEMEQLNTAHSHTMSTLESELKNSRQATTEARSEAQGLGKEAAFGAERVRELTAALEAAQSTREEELRAALAARAGAEGARSEGDVKLAELTAKLDATTTTLQKLEASSAAERSAAQLEATEMRAQLQESAREVDALQSKLKRTTSSKSRSARQRREALRSDASTVQRQVTRVREDCTVLRTEVKMKLEMMKNDVLRELGELQWHHKEDITKVVGSLQSQSRTTKQIYEDKMDRFREQLEQEYGQATERLKGMHELEIKQLRVDLSAERDETLGRLKPELMEAQSALRQAQTAAQSQREAAERQAASLQQELAVARRELDEARLAHTEAKLEGASQRSERSSMEDRVRGLTEKLRAMEEAETDAKASVEQLNDVKRTVSYVVGAVGKRVSLPHGCLEGLLSSSAAATGEALSAIDAALAQLATATAEEAQARHDEIVTSLRAQLETMQGGAREYEDKVREMEAGIGRLERERDAAMSANAEATSSSAAARQAHEAALARVRKECELEAEKGKAEAVTPYRARIEAMQTQVDELERRTVEQLQEKERRVAEQLSSSAFLAQEEMRAAERIHADRLSEAERTAQNASMELSRLQNTAAEAERRAQGMTTELSASKEELNALRRQMTQEAEDATRAKEDARQRMRGAEEELEAQRGELGEFRRKVEGERKNYKRLLKAQEAKMREQEKARAVLEERERHLHNTVRDKEVEIHSMNEEFQQSYEQLDVGIVERELTERLMQLNQKLTAAVSAPSLKDRSPTAY